MKITNTIQLVLALNLLYVFTFTAHARDDATLISGEYIADGGWGALSISQAGANEFTFELNTMGANAHMCQLDGKIRNRKAVLDTDNPKQPCVVEFKPMSGGIKVQSDAVQACRYFCGERAFFDGEYLVPPEGCMPKERHSTEAKFTRLYKAKKYSKASDMLSTMLHNCKKTIDWLEAGSIRNDLAITLYHLRRYSECSQVLNPILEIASGNEEDLRKSLPPTDFENYLPIAKAAWHNAKLCSRKGER